MSNEEQATTPEAQPAEAPELYNQKIHQQLADLQKQMAGIIARNKLLEENQNVILASAQPAPAPAKPEIEYFKEYIEPLATTNLFTEDITTSSEWTAESAFKCGLAMEMYNIKNGHKTYEEVFKEWKNDPIWKNIYNLKKSK